MQFGVGGSEVLASDHLLMRRVDLLHPHHPRTHSSRQLLNPPLPRTGTSAATGSCNTAGLCAKEELVRPGCILGRLVLQR